MYINRQGDKMDSEKKKFGARLKELREKSGLNQEQLAELINMESRHLSRIETGKSFTTLDNIVKISKVLKTEVKSLFSYEHKKDRNAIIKEIDDIMDKVEDDKPELLYRLINDIVN